MSEQSSIEPSIVVPRKGLRGVGIFYGQPKIGKSTLAASLVDACIDTENGLQEIPGILRYKATTMGLFRESIRHAIGNGFRKISIDTLDHVNDWHEDDICSQYNVKGIGQIKDFGASWGESADKMLALISRLRGDFDLILLVGHQRLATIDSEATKSRYVDLPGRLSRKICAEADFIGLCELDDNGHRIVNFKPYNNFDSGSRLKPLRNQSFKFYEDLSKNRELFENIFKEGEDNAKDD